MEINDDELEKLRRKLEFKVRHHLGSWSADVEDIVQETIVRLLRSAQNGAIRNSETWGAFARAICDNVIHEHRRRYWREVDEQITPPNAATDSHAAAVEARELVTRTLAKLPIRDQHLLRAFYLEEKGVEEICSSMGLTRGNLRVALFRAKERFRDFS